MTFIVQRIIFIFVIGVLFISCGLPDVNTIALSLNEPFITRIIPGDNSITVEFVSQNDEPAFSGYNIYFSHDQTQPRFYSIRNEQGQLPTVNADGSPNIKTETFTIEVGLNSVTQGVEGVEELDDGNIVNGLPLYIWVTSYQIAPTRESPLYNYNENDGFIVEGTPRFETINQTRTVSQNMTIESNPMATLVNVDGALYLQNADTTMQMRTARSLTDINIPSSTGYSSANLPVIAGRLYLIRKDTGGGNILYGKIFVKSVNGTTSIVVDYCLQTADNILSY